MELHAEVVVLGGLGGVKPGLVLQGDGSRGLGGELLLDFSDHSSWEWGVVKEVPLWVQEKHECLWGWRHGVKAFL